MLLGFKSYSMLKREQPGLTMATCLLFVFASLSFTQAITATVSPGHPLTSISHIFTPGIVDVVTTSLQRLQAIVVDVETQLAHIHASSNHSSCYRDVEENVAALVTLVESEIVVCVGDEILAMEVVVANLGRLAGEAVDVVLATLSDITACLDHPIASSCLVEATLVAGVVIADAGAALEQDLRRVREKIASTQEDMATCASGALVAAWADAQQIVVVVAQCIIDNLETTAIPDTNEGDTIIFGGSEEEGASEDFEEGIEDSEEGIEDSEEGTEVHIVEPTVVHIESYMKSPIRLNPRQHW